ncbi:MAG: DUF4838 domain-containing protein [Clostridia bacterium]|nr:DUF4838 domain-containing protein [Clostridia bacterium]
MSSALPPESLFSLPQRIVILPNVQDGPVGYAARELGRCLANAGCAIQISADGTANSGFFIRLCWEEQLTDLEDGAFRISVTAQGITLKSGKAAGQVYGAYALLEKLGWRFLAKDCEITPHAPLRLPLGTWEEHPAFSVREIFWRGAMDGEYAVKLRLNSARSTITPDQGGKAMFYNFSHTFDQLVPVKTYFDTHPEYFSMRDGVRVRERTQLCLTNPDVLRLCTEGVLKWKREHPEYTIFSVSMNDWYNNCQCPACRKIDEEEGSSAGTVIRFVNAVADNVTKIYPDVRIHTFAYLYCRKPPKLTRPHPSVIVRLCSIECCYSHPIAQCGCEISRINVQGTFAHAFTGDPHVPSSFMRDLAGWSKLCKNQLFIWDYTTNYANYLQPFPNLHVLADNLRTFRQYGASGVLEQGNFSLGRASALGDLKVYLLGKLLWNPDLNPEELIREFAEGYWENGAEAMLRYIDLWRKAVKDAHMSIYDPPDAAYLSEPTLTTAEAYLREALEKTQGAAHERLEREALSLRYVRLAQEDPTQDGHAARVDAFAADAKRLGISELFERRDLEGSFEVLRTSHLTQDRSAAKPIRYPI